MKAIDCLKPLRRATLVMTSFAVTVFFTVRSVSAQETLKPWKTIALPGVKGRFDHFAIDTKGQRLFVAALGNNTLEVLALAEAQHAKSIRALHKPTGVLYLTQHNQIVVG